MEILRMGTDVGALVEGCLMVGNDRVMVVCDKRTAKKLQLKQITDFTGDIANHQKVTLTELPPPQEVLVDGESIQFGYSWSCWPYAIEDAQIVAKLASKLGLLTAVCGWPVEGEPRERFRIIWRYKDGVLQNG